MLDVILFFLVEKLDLCALLLTSPGVVIWNFLIFNFMKIPLETPVSGKHLRQEVDLVMGTV